MEPTRRLSPALLPQRRAAHLARWADESDTREPIPGSASIMRKGQQPNYAVPFQICDVVRKAGDRKPTCWYVPWDARNDSADLRPSCNLVKCIVDGLNEFNAETGALTVVPNGCVFEFSGRFGFRPEDPVHLSVNRCRMRARTSSHGSPVDSPFMTLRARRSISRAQAASTSAGLSGGASSRLASNSAATSARSSVGSVRASRKRACARVVTR